MTRTLQKVFALLMAGVLTALLAVPAFAVEREVVPEELPTDILIYHDVDATGSGKHIIYPKALRTSKKKWPVITWANGSWCPTETYMGVIRRLAEAGYVVISDTDVLTNDGVSTLDSVDYAIALNKKKGSPFYHKLDTNKIGSTGHSFGGQDAVIAAGKSSRIQCIVSLAGKSVAKEARKVKVPALYIGGDLDAIVPINDYVLPSYEASQGPAVYVTRKHSGHFQCWITPDDYADYTALWFDAWLKGNTSAKKVFQKGGRLPKDTNYTDYSSKNL